jgi:hypothetical protein
MGCRCVVLDRKRKNLKYFANSTAIMAIQKCGVLLQLLASQKSLLIGSIWRSYARPGRKLVGCDVNLRTVNAILIVFLTLWRIAVTPNASGQALRKPPIMGHNSKHFLLPKFEFHYSWG